MIKAGRHAGYEELRVLKALVPLCSRCHSFYKGSLLSCVDLVENFKTCLLSPSDCKSCMSELGDMRSLEGVYRHPIHPPKPARHCIMRKTETIQDARTLVDHHGRNVHKKAAPIGSRRGTKRPKKSKQHKKHSLKFPKPTSRTPTSQQAPKAP